MAHVAKFTRAASGHLLAHYDREAENISNESIDPSLTHLNFNLGPERDISQGDFIRQRCSEVKMQNRKDVNVMCSWVLTKPTDLPEYDERRFFEESYSFMADRYGKENVISAYVHMDETTPHMHFAFVPVVRDKKKDIDKVSAKEAVDRADLQTFHDDLSKRLSDVFGRDVGVLNDATKYGNKSIGDLKRTTAAQEAAKVANALQDALIENQALRGQNKALQAKIEGLEAQLRERATPENSRHDNGSMQPATQTRPGIHSKMNAAKTQIEQNSQKRLRPSHHDRGGHER